MVSSHALDDIGSVYSFGEDDNDTNLELRNLASSLEHNDVVSPQQLSGAKLQKVPKQLKIPSGPAPPPAKPLKWQTRLADRATAAVNLEAHYQVPPQLLFDLLADPTQHERIFDDILAADSELLESDGPRRKWRLDYTARWSFWRVSGVCQNRLWMWTDSDAGTVTFSLREPGFLKKYEGTWTIKASCGTPLSAIYAFTRSSSPTSTQSALSLFSSSSGSSSGGISRASSNSSSSRMSSPPSSPLSRASSSSGCDPASADMFIGARSGSSSPRMAAFASMTAAAVSLPLKVGHGVSSAVTALGHMQAAWWFGSSSSNNSVNTGGSSSRYPCSYTAGLSSITSSIRNSITSWFTSKQSPSRAPSSSTLPPFFRESNSSSGSSSRRSSFDANNASGEAEQQSVPLFKLPTASIITASTLTSPKLTPPYPLNLALKTQSKGQVEDMLEGLVRAAVAQLQSQSL